VPDLGAIVNVYWTGDVTIPPDAVDPTGTYPTDAFKMRLYTNSSRSVEMLVVSSA
jgi:hypothetical protein